MEHNDLINADKIKQECKSEDDEEISAGCINTYKSKYIYIISYYIQKFT